MFMKANLKNYLLIGRFFLMGVIGASLLTACSDDDDPEPDPVALGTPVKSGDAVATANSLTFSWQSVANASSYSYVLKNASGTTVDSGTTTYTTLYFSGLQSNSTYTLEVTAVSSDTSAYTNSGTLTLTGTTSGPTALATPQVSAKAGARTVVSWNAVNNAEAYVVSYEDVVDTVTATSINLDFLTLDKAITISVVAINGSDELALDSEAGKATVTRTRKEVSHARAATTVWDNDASAYVTTDVKYRITAYDDGSYTIKDWYGFSGYDLTFMQVEQGTGTIKIDGTNYDDYPDYAWLDIPGANTYDGLQVYTGEYGGYSYAGFDGDVASSGSFWIWDNTKYEQFCISWEQPTATYTGTWEKDENTTVNVTINQYSDGIYTIENWYGYEGYDFDFTLDSYYYINPTSQYALGDDWYHTIPTGPDSTDSVTVYVWNGYGAWGTWGGNCIWIYVKELNGYYKLMTNDIPNLGE
jgi:hypothetical protein